MSFKAEVTAFKRQRILNAAAQLFYDRGYEGTSVDLIAAHIDSTKQFIYFYFKGKSEILFEVCQRGSMLALEGARQVSSSRSTPERQLAELIKSFTGVVCNENVSIAVFVREEKNLDPEAIETISKQRREFDSILRLILQSGKKTGAFEIDDVTSTARLMSGMVNFTFTWYQQGGPLSVEALSELTAHLALRMVQR